MSSFLEFIESDAAGVSAEFIVVAAGTVALGLAVMATLADGMIDASAAAGGELESRASISYGSIVD
ncbi:hypothetical protein SAMN05216257_103169 [Meinhardsimonia xiamenensis]|jgi:hypothetical protein|uniref:Uncharacterized protein n=1 Tax=Meinhardsimonia xiamenensis TaxID=990712 RepID=A0A1G9CN33_9RHOB|nr:hypothetical protein [Meinhardsimonia xiamenensis]PRX38304.1 hypothetical protein LV81_00585 [Meinhardsimonia xiamenensis]SDK52999.1 hypothetical protein SAMN05216257_103169 [Meinhardsimonia xiamenensis]